MSTPKKKPPGRWKPGESGNPAGRKPGTCEVAAIRAAIADRVPELLAAMMTRASAPINATSYGKLKPELTNRLVPHWLAPRLVRKPKSPKS